MFDTKAMLLKVTNDIKGSGSVSKADQKLTVNIFQFAKCYENRGTFFTAEKGDTQRYAGKAPLRNAAYLLSPRGKKNPCEAEMTVSSQQLTRQFIFIIYFTNLYTGYLK